MPPIHNQGSERDSQTVNSNVYRESVGWLDPTLLGAIKLPQQRAASSPSSQAAPAAHYTPATCKSQQALLIHLLVVIIACQQGGCIDSAFEGLQYGGPILDPHLNHSATCFSSDSSVPSITMGQPRPRSCRVAWMRSLSSLQVGSQVSGSQWIKVVPQTGTPFIQGSHCRSRSGSRSSHPPAQALPQ